VDDVEDEANLVGDVHLPIFVNPNPACVLLEQLADATSRFSAGGSIILKFTPSVCITCVSVRTSKL
jgi:hypothetical protein